mgnify:CR=1 FL=1
MNSVKKPMVFSIKNVLLYAFGGLFIALGVVLMIRSNLGTSSWDSLHFSLSNMFGFSIGISATDQLVLILLITVFAATTSTLYAIINMLFPKFDYINEAEVVKQSAGALLGILGGFSMIAILGIFYSLMADTASFTEIALYMVGINLVILIPLVYIVKTKSEYLFSKMKA